MKKIGVVTLNDYVNYGNRLQNYALVKYLNGLDDCMAYNIWPKSIKFQLKDLLKRVIISPKFRRISKFRKFNKLINTVSKYDGFDYYITGSDQVWNPQWAASDQLLLNNVNSNNKISYAASFGVKELTKQEQKRFKKSLSQFKCLSVRENTAKNIIDNLNIENDVEVLIDPTMLLDSNEWKEVSHKPKVFFDSDKYILNYFLGELSDQRKVAIEKFAFENDCKIINLMDPKDLFYTCGPSEFLWLEEHAFLICTDSFHSSVFAIIFDRPFVIFDREQKENKDMSTRIDTLLTNFEIKNRKFNGHGITKENLIHDYCKAFQILEKEKEKSKLFLEQSLDIIK